jgi:uncharacterized membrane protein
MSEDRFGMPDHAPRHDQPLQSTTAQGSWANIGGDSWTAPSTPSGGGYVGGGGGYVSSVNVAGDPRKSVLFTVVLSMLFGPLGLFYVGILHGLVALFTVIPIARTLGIPLAFAFGVDPVWAVVAVIWCITVPWAIIGITRRNRRYAR